MILIIIQFGELSLGISPKTINSLRSYIKHLKECFIHFQTSRSWPTKTRLRLNFSIYFSVFGNWMKHSSSCLIYCIKDFIFI